MTATVAKNATSAANTPKNQLGPSNGGHRGPDRRDGQPDTEGDGTTTLIQPIRGRHQRSEILGLFVQHLTVDECGDPRVDGIKKGRD